MPTENMKKFILKNVDVKIVEGERLTPEGNRVSDSNDFFRSDRVRYRFTDGIVMVVTGEDTQSAPEFNPDWAL
jgi:hypothetical protein